MQRPFSHVGVLVIAIALLAAPGLARHVPEDGAGVGFEAVGREDFAHSPLFSEVTPGSAPAAAGAPALPGRAEPEPDADSEGTFQIPLEEILRAPTQTEVDRGAWHEPTKEEITPRPPPPAPPEPGQPTEPVELLEPEDDPEGPVPLTDEQLAAVVHREPGTVRIASWNLLNLSEPRELARRARVMAHFDLLALQEVKKPSTLNKLRRELQALTGATWHRQVSPKVGKGQKAEHLAFLYRTDRVQSARIQEGRGVFKNTRKVRFDRPPFYASFRAGQFDFTVVNYHARWGSSREISREVEQLPVVVEWVQERNGDEQDVLVMGDFNRDRPSHPAFVPMRRIDYEGVVDPPGGFSTYSSTADGAGANLYDNIFLNRTFTEAEFTGASGVLYPHELFFQDRDAPHLVARIRISDHCPVWAEFGTTQDDD